MNVLIQKESKKPPMIFGTVIKLTENIDGTSAGEYLYIETDFLDERGKYIPIQEFNDLLNSAKNKNKTIKTSDILPVGVGDSENPITERATEKLDFGDLLKFLKEKINIKFVDGEDELIISSNKSIFLELPWEDVVDKNITIYREVVGADSTIFEKKENNLALFVSHAYKNYNGDLGNLREKIDEEVAKIYSLIPLIKKDEVDKSFRINRVLLSIHTTKTFLQSIRIEEYNFLHFIMHGNDKGELLLEDQYNYERIDPMTIVNLLAILKGNNFRLIFLSFCYSGGGVSNYNNLAFEIINAGISQYVIGYSYPVGEKSAVSFTNSFYGSLLNGDKKEDGKDKLKEIYKNALLKYYNNSEIITKEKKYIPFLYIKK